MNWIKNWLLKKSCEHKWVMFDEITKTNYNTGRVVALIYVQQCEKCGMLSKTIVND